MVRECCVCKNSRQDAILYRFPCNRIRQNLWLKCLNREDLNDQSSDNFSKLFVCAKHFEKKFVTTTATSSRSRLLQRAYPSLITEEEIASGIPSQEYTENRDPQTEHSYSRKIHFDHTYNKREPLKENIYGSRNLELNLPGPSQNMPAEYTPANIASGTGLDDQEPSISAPSVHKLGSSASVIVHKPTKKRLFNKVKNLTPTAKIIYDEYKKAKKQLDFYRRAKRAIKFNKEKHFEKLTQSMNPYAKKIMKMQMKLCTKSKKGRRFSAEEKLIALSIMKQSPKCYKFLHKIFILPSRSTLNKMVAKLPVEPGICPRVFQLIKKEVTSWNERKKICSVVFDEMALETALSYDKNKDAINGFVHLETRKDEFADHALVFMLRGAVYKWQQPVAFYYCKGATSGHELKNFLRQVISAVTDCGLKPIAVICDQGSGFQAALKSFREDTRRNQILFNQEPDDTVTISGVNLSIIFDPSHLIKGLRNNFIDKNIKIDEKVSKWSDIVDIYKTDCNPMEARICTN